MKFEDIERKEIKSLGMPLVQYKANHVQVIAAEGVENGRKWATIYEVVCEPNFRNQGRTQAVLSVLKRKYEDEQYEFGYTVALNPTMAHIWRNLTLRNMYERKTNVEQLRTNRGWRAVAKERQE